MSINIYDPRVMLSAIQQILPVNTFLKNTFFPNIVTFPTEKVDVDYSKGRRKMAPFVSPRLPGTLLERPGFTTKTYTAPMIKPKTVLTADDLQKRGMGEHIYSGKSPDERAAEKMARDMAELDETITRREEWMVSQVLFTGKVEMIGDGVDEYIDFDFTNKVVLTGDSKWANPKSNPLGDLKNWRLSIIQKSGITPDMVVMASDVVDAFINHPGVQKVMDTQRIILGKIDPRVLPNGVTYIGSISSLGLDIYSYDEWFFDESDEVEKPLVPSGSVMVASTRARSSLLYGAVTLADEKNGGFITYEATRVPDSWMKKDPAARFLQINSRPLPVPHEVDSWYVAQVL